MGYNLSVSPSRRPKLGQHFLSSEGYRRRIVNSLALRPEDLVIEVGPGRGAMTELLAERAGRVVAVELDAGLASDLLRKLEHQPGVEVIQGDILATDVKEICRKRGAKSCFVFGNLPYYITSPIIHHLMNSAGVIRGMALLVQREVAERLTAQPGTRDYGYLSVRVRVHSEPRIAMGVPPGAFSPPPKVHSALVEFAMKPKFPAWTAQDLAAFLEFIQRCFAQKRKNLLNNLGQVFSKDRLRQTLDRLHLPPTARAEELTVEQFAELREKLKG
ncbi:MAG: ribosomal RNA small subunit methyltransferase A [Acidobacteria bacterium]|nr:ribosomal RNA small subunit methyltransferase A [Acidobacteriota bacterium]